MGMHGQVGRFGCVVAAVAALVAGSRDAAADPSAPIVIESYRDERPADADALLAPVIAELGRRGYTGGDALVARLSAHSIGAGQLTAGQSVEAQRHVDRGYQSFIDGEYAAAAASVEKALALYAQAPGQMAREDALRDLQFKALLVGARSYEVLGRGEDAFRTMAEAIRTFPDRHVSTAEFDPKVNALFRRVKQELTKQGTGSLEVKVDDAAAVVFVNERFVGTGSARLDGLLPGAYRVYVAKGAQTGRVRRVQVSSGAAAAVAVSWPLDGVLRSRAGYVGLELPAGEIDELALATRVGRDLGARSVVVLGIRPVDGRRAIVGFAVSTESQTRSFAALQVEPVEPPRERLTTLAGFLAGDKKVAPAGLITREPRQARVDGDRDDGAPRGRPLRTLKWITTAAGVAGVAAGATLYLVDGGDTIDGMTRSEESFNGKTPGLITGGVGVALLGVGIYMFIADPGGDEQGPALSIYPTEGGAGVGMAGRF